MLQENESLLFVNAADPISNVQETLRTSLLANIGHSNDEVRRKFLIIRLIMNSVYDFAESNPQVAKQALELYYQHYVDLVAQDKSALPKVKNLLAEEDQIMNDLLRKYPAFYRDRYFGMKSRLELEWLNLLPEGNDKNEEKQTIISDKIDFLRQLKVFFLADKIQLDDAKQIVFRLFKEADDLQLPADQQAAIGDLFAKRLQDFGVFFRYLSSPEYVSTNLHGTTRQQQFDAFLQAQQEQIDINQVRKEILGDQTNSTVSVTQILAGVEKDFGSVGVTNLQLGNLDNTTVRFVEIKTATYNNVVFQAQYDWDKKLISAVTSNGAVLSNDGIRIENLPLLLNGQTSPNNPTTNPVTTVPTTPATTTPTPTVSKTDRVAKILLIQKLKANGISVSEDQIMIVNISQNAFSIQGAHLVTDQQNTSFNFYMQGKDSMVSALVVNLASGAKNVDGVFALSELSGKVTAVTASGS